jgi:DNA-directed RNA polymerase specialized sigma24 family protein
MLDEADVPGGVGPDIDMIALDVALQELAALDPRQAQLVELRFFAGLTVPEAAVVMGVSPITVKRDWALAKAWLFRALRGAS